MPRNRVQRWKGIVAVVGVSIGVVALAGAQNEQIKPKEADRLTAQIVAELIERAHISNPEIDDEVSRQWHKQYIKLLDPQKLYFTQADIEEFEAFEDELDDQIRRGDLSFAQMVFDRYLERRNERMEAINELLDGEFDFTIDETYVDDPEEIDFPADADDARDRWRKQLKYQLLSMTLDGETEMEEAVERLQIRYKDLHRFYTQFEMLELLEVYLTALAMSIDPHSSYLNWKNLEDMMKQQLELSLEGIGAQLSMENGVPTVKGIVPGGAADKDGRLKPEDQILGVELEDGETKDFVEKKLSDVVRVIRGKRGTKVRLIVQPAGTKERKIYEITREKIDLADERAKGEVIEVEAENGQPVRVGVIDVPSFYGNAQAVREGNPDATSATLDVMRILDDFKEQDVDCVLVDLRSNGGGLLLEAISLSGLFIDTGPVVRVRDAQGILPYEDEEEGTAWNGPLAVLIDHYSASASEIFAGVIKDYGRGLIIGDASTYGKGTVQSIIDLNRWLRGADNLPNLGALKLTIQQFYRANGMSTQVRGVRPHIHIPSPVDHIEKLGEGGQENALAFDEIDPEPHDFYGRAPSDLVARLDARSRARRKADEEFQKQAKTIEKLIERQRRHQVPLEKEAFRKEFGDEEENELETPLNPGLPEHDADKDDVWNRDSFYNKEVMRIVADYITLGSKVIASAPVPAEEIDNDSR